MFFYVNTFTSTEDGIAEKLLLFKIKFVVIFNLLIIYNHFKYFYYNSTRRAGSS